MRLGASNISALRLGAQAVQKAYLGAVEVYNAGAPQSPAVHEKDLNSFTLESWVGKPPGFDEKPGESLGTLIHLHGTGARGHGVDVLLTVDSTTPTTEIHDGNYPHDILTISPYKAAGDWSIPDVAAFVQSLLDNVKKYKIDSTRIFLTGLSLGGIGASQYIFLQSSNDLNYIPIAGAFPMAGGTSGVGPTEAQYMIDKNILVRGWLGQNETNGYATVMSNNASEANAIQANSYELNIVPGAGHSVATWGVPYSDHSATSIYADVENSVSSNVIPSDVIEEYAIHRYRFNEVLQQDGSTPAAIGDPVYEFVDIARFGRHNLVWAGTGTPPPRTATHIEIGTANNIVWQHLLNAPMAQPLSFFMVMENLAGENFDTFINTQGAVVQANGGNLRLNAGTTATFSAGKPADGATSILQFNINGANSELFVGNIANASNPQNAGANKVTLLRIGTSGGGANWRFKEMFFTPLLDPAKATEIFNALNSVYP